MLAAGGKVTISPVGATLNRDLDTFSKMDPYCQIDVGGVKQQTKPDEGGGKNPKWSGYSWTFQVEDN